MGHVWLIGMMGTGKTTVGAIVAEQREMPLEDTDTRVMERTGQTIPELFGESEARFRLEEAAAIEELAAEGNAVISTGGGAILRPDSVELMRDTGHTVLLTADTQELEHRLADDLTRPLLSSPGALAAILAERAPLYEAAAEVMIDTTGKLPGEVASEVLAWLDM
ncbi:MAG: shikimate kinase [Acidimicrobiia bacterium]